MSEYVVDARPYYQILHAMFRHDELDRDADYSLTVFDWFSEHHALMLKVTSKAEWRIIQMLIQHYIKHKSFPSRGVMPDLIGGQSQAQALSDILKEYDEWEAELKEFAVPDLNVQLDMRVDQYERYKFVKLLAYTQEITINSVQLQDKTKTILSGTGDALNYLMERIQQGVRVTDKPSAGGSLYNLVDKVQVRYEGTVEDRKYNNLFIQTGVSAIDIPLGGLRRKDVCGILGYVANRKTGMARTMGYNAAAAGRNVLHIPLETDVEEENDAYLVMHAQALTKGDRVGITKQALEKGELSTEDGTFLFTDIVADYKARVASNITVKSPTTRTWEEVRSIIEREGSKKPLDLVIIDYLTLLGTPGTRDERGDKTAIAQEAKQLALNAYEGRGMCIVTPIQGSRKGMDEAEGRDGKWETSGIFMYSELDKSLDICFYVFLDDGLKAEGKIKIGTCKTRRADDIPVSIIPINKASGLIGFTPANTVMLDVQLPNASVDGAKSEHIKSGIMPPVNFGVDEVIIL